MTERGKSPGNVACSKRNTLVQYSLARIIETALVLVLSTLHIYMARSGILKSATTQTEVNHSDWGNGLFGAKTKIWMGQLFLLQEDVIWLLMSAGGHLRVPSSADRVMKYIDERTTLFECPAIYMKEIIIVDLVCRPSADKFLDYANATTCHSLNRNAEREPKLHIRVTCWQINVVLVSVVYIKAS